MKAYLVHKLDEKLTVNVLGKSIDIPAIWDKGMIGVLPVYKDRESAMKHADNDDALISVIKFRGEK